MRIVPIPLSSRPTIETMENDRSSEVGGVSVGLSLDISTGRQDNYRTSTNSRQTLPYPTTSSAFRHCFDRNSRNESSSSKPLIKMNPFAFYPDEEPSPRASLWTYLSASSLAALTSVVVMEHSFDVYQYRDAQDTVLISVLSISFGVAVLVSLCYRHRMLRDFITSELPRVCISIEFILSLSLLLIWCIEMRFVMDPLSGVEFGMALANELGHQCYDDVWNGNLWVASWMGGGVAAILVGELMMAPPEKQRGVLIRHQRTMMVSDNESNGNIAEQKVYTRTYSLDENGPTYWFLSLIVSCALSAFCIVHHNLSCDGVLNSTPYCKRALLGSVIGLVCASLSVGSLIVHRLNRKKWNSTKERMKKLWTLESSLSALSLILHCVDVGYVTSPGGPGSEIGNIFLTAWLGVVISTVLCVKVEKGWVLIMNISGYNESIDGGDMNCRTNDNMTDVNRISIPNERDVEKGNSHFCGPGRANRVFISKASNSYSDSSSEESDDSSSSSNSSSDIVCIRRLDTTGERSSSTTYSLPSPPRVLEDSPTIESNSRGGVMHHGGDLLSRGVTTDTEFPCSRLPYTSYQYSSTQHEMDRSGECSIEPGDDDESAPEICFEPDDVSSLGISMLSLEPSSVDPEGYKSEDYYAAAPAAEAWSPEPSSPKTFSSRNPISKRGSRSHVLRSDVLQTVEEKSVESQRKKDLVYIAMDAEVRMNDAIKSYMRSYPRSRSEGDQSCFSNGPLTVDASECFVDGATSKTNHTSSSPLFIK